MAYYQPNYQPYPYQDQLSQLRSYPMRPDPSGLNWVQGEAGAKSWIVPPGGTALLMDSETQRFYLKTADLSGVPNLRTFEYSEIGAAPVQPKADYVTREEFERFVQSLTQKKTEVENA